MNDQEQKQRERAYMIWEHEGRVDGLHEEHWKRAGEQPEFEEQDANRNEQGFEGDTGGNGKKRQAMETQLTSANPY